MSSRSFIILEFLILCLLVPGLLIFYQLAPYMFAFLWGAAIYCWVVLRTTTDLSLKQLWSWDQVKWSNLKSLMVRWVIASIGMALFLAWYDGEKLWLLSREQPQFLPILFIGYPILSALPQEFIFCSFFFVRYKSLFKMPWLLILMSSLTFAFAHCLYLNPVAPPLSFIAGVIFAVTYWKTKSLALVTIEHGLYGNALFFTGLGWYFYTGAVPGS